MGAQHSFAEHRRNVRSQAKPGTGRQDQRHKNQRSLGSTEFKHGEVTPQATGLSCPLPGDTRHDSTWGGRCLARRRVVAREGSRRQKVLVDPATVDAADDLVHAAAPSRSCSPDAYCPRGEDAPPPTKFVPAKSYVFPRGKCNRSCQHAWFVKFPWLHYDAERDMQQQLSKAKGARVVELLTSNCAKQQRESREALRVIVSSIRYLCRTGQALLGHTQQFGNLVDVLQERCEDVPALKTWLSRRDKWLSNSDIQNEIIKIMAHTLQREILEDIKVTPFFGIIADGTTDVAGDEHRLRGHCFDGAANMSGRFSGVQKRIVDVQPKSIYVRCASHSLDLALQEVGRSSVIVADALCAVKDVSNAILTSAKRKATYSGIVLPPCVDDARAISAKASSLLPLCPTRALQSPKYSATGTKQAAKALCQTMANLRTEDGFDRVFEETQNAAMRLGLDQSETAVATRVKPPTRFEHSIKPAPPVVLDAKTKLRKEYFAAVDCVVPVKASDAFGPTEASNYGRKRENCYGDSVRMSYS
ncbi:hypothetical protein HPB52_006375 [Rhipicephalus sanguineus]|uniref:DUF4371 domain-containing protein n=1 Tax=Rhipicephalus sanguineus TaxID=34632 RepID=A0A9D4Q4L9_RHISA|nr:hypothetical protein HPB52_006375 [Rhipicephalus sanguineus]